MNDEIQDRFEDQHTNMLKEDIENFGPYKILIWRLYGVLKIASRKLLKEANESSGIITNR